MNPEQLIANEVRKSLSNQGYSAQQVESCVDVAVKIFFRTTSFKKSGGGLAKAAVDAGIAHAKNYRPSAYFHKPTFTRRSPGAIARIEKKYADIRG